MLVKFVHLDFETRSRADLRKCGATLYAEHDSTEVMCIVFAEDDDPPVLITENDLRHWTPACERLKRLAQDPSVIFVAHNAAFEQAIWRAIMVKRWGMPVLGIPRWKCTMAKAYAAGLPGSLEDAGKVMRLPIQKDVEGRAIMLRLAKPRRNGDFWYYEDDPATFERLYDYCKGDVLSERMLDKRIRDLLPLEQMMWQIDQRMNQQGLHVDLTMVERAIELSAIHKTAVKKECNDITGGIAPTQRKLLLSWLQRAGIAVGNTRKATVKMLMDSGKLPEDIREALRLVGEANKTSVAKYTKMLAMSAVVSIGVGLMRDQLQFHAAHTGRWGGRGAQIQNLPRPWMDVKTCAKSIKSLGYESFSLLYDDVLGALSSTLRGAIIASPGKRLLVADLSQMESRVIAWLAGQQNVLDLYERGEDLYCKAASDIFGYHVPAPVDGEHYEFKMERQVGKVAVLALGYGGGINAFAKMCEAYDIDLMPVFFPLWGSATQKEKDNAQRAYEFYIKRAKEPVNKRIAFVADLIKQRWRIANGRIAKYWYETEQCIIKAIETKKPVQCGKVTWFTSDIFLYCKLPSGRFMSYPYPKITETKGGKKSISYHSARYNRITTYGGKLVENITQAVQRDILRDAIIRLEEKYPVAFHIHDEVVAEVAMGEGSLEEFVNIMKFKPSWAFGIPIDAKGWESRRYGKDEEWIEDEEGVA